MAKKLITFTAMVLLCICGTHVQAKLAFKADFASNGIYESSWPLVPGQIIAIDIYVSNVPEPGLITMGFKVLYDSDKLELIGEGTFADSETWSYSSGITINSPGDIDIDGMYMPGLDEDDGHLGDNIRLGTVKFLCLSEGSSEIMILRREKGSWFVLFDEDLEDPSLDSDIGEGVSLASIHPPVKGDVDGNGIVDLADLIMILKFMTRVKTGHIHNNANVNGDGVIGLNEAIYIIRSISGLSN